MATFTGSRSDTKRFWFDAQGFSGVCLNDQIRAFLQNKNANKDIDLNTQWYIFLSQLGHTGSTTDMYRAALIAGLSLTSGTPRTTADLEISFYGNSVNQFA